MQEKASYAKSKGPVQPQGLFLGETERFAHLSFCFFGGGKSLIEI